MSYRSDAKSIFKQSAFFEPSSSAHSEESLAQVLPAREPLELKSQARDSTYKDTFNVYTGLESQVLGLHAIFQDTQPELETQLNDLITLSQEYNKTLDATQKNDINTAFLEAVEAYKAKQEEMDRAYVLAMMLCYYATVLQQHYERYSHKEKIKQYEQIAKEAEQFIIKKSLVDEHLNDIEQLAAASLNQEDEHRTAQTHLLLNAIKQDTKGALNSFKEGLLRTSKWRDTLSAINLQRIYWIFCHFVMSQLQAMALQIQQTLSHYLHRDMSWVLKNVDDLGKMVDGPKDFLNILSVALFGIRFVIDMIMIVKHASNYFGDKEENEIDFKKRAKAELEKRAFDMANNIVWGTANFITNYNELCHIPGETALQIIAALLVFDALLLQARLLKARRDYHRNRASLVAELGVLKASKQRAIDKPTRKSIAQQEDIVLLQIKALDDDWYVQKAAYQYYTLAAVILCASFSATLSIFAIPPVAVLACYVIGIAATAMYLSGNLYADYIAKKQAYLDAKENVNSDKPASKETIAKLKADYMTAKHAFIKSMVEKTVIPTIIFIAFATNVFAGASILSLYLIIKLSIYIHKKYNETKTHDKKEVSAPNRYNLFNKAEIEKKNNAVTPSKEDKANPGVSSSLQAQHRACLT